MKRKLEPGLRVRILSGKDTWITHSVEAAAVSGKMIWKVYLAEDSCILTEAYDYQLRTPRGKKFDTDYPLKLWIK